MRLIQRGVRQRPFVLEHLAEITAVDPAAAGLGTGRNVRPRPLEDRRHARLDICRAGSSAELAKLLHHDPAALDFVETNWVAAAALADATSGASTVAEDFALGAQ